MAAAEHIRRANLFRIEKKLASIHLTLDLLNNNQPIVFASDTIDTCVFFKDPEASYDVNDGDPDPQPRYTQLNDNRYTDCISLFFTVFLIEEDMSK